MKVAIGYDPNSIAYARRAYTVCQSLGIEVISLQGEDPIYANSAFHTARLVVSGKADRGILICATGIGMSIAANKVKGAYAALISDVYSAVRAELSNHANIACFGASTIGEKLLEELVRTWLLTEYVDGTPSAPKIERIEKYEAQEMG